MPTFFFVCLCFLPSSARIKNMSCSKLWIRDDRKRITEIVKREKNLLLYLSKRNRLDAKRIERLLIGKNP